MRHHVKWMNELQLANERIQLHVEYVRSTDDDHAKEVIIVEYSNHIIRNELHEQSLFEVDECSERRQHSDIKKRDDITQFHGTAIILT